MVILLIYSVFEAVFGAKAGASSVFFYERIGWMFGKTPSWAIVTSEKSIFNSSLKNCLEY